MKTTSKRTIPVSMSMVSRIAAAIAFAAVLLTGGGVIAVATVTPAAAAPCGGLNQRACPPLKKGPVCKQWLRKVNKTCRPCGGLNQKACAVLAKGRVCKTGLTKKRGKCVRKRNDKAAYRAQAKTLAEKSKSHLPVLNSVRTCLNQSARKKKFANAVKKRNKTGAAQIASACVSDDTRRQLQARPLGVSGGSADKFFNTLSIGVGGGGMVIVGGAVDAGIVIDLNRKWHVRFYTNSESSFGAGANVGLDVIVGLGRDLLNRGLYRNLAVVAAGKYFAGGGVAVVFDYGNPLKEDLFDGFAVSGGAGAGAEIGTIHKSKSRVWGFPCKAVDVTVTNNTGSKIKIIDLDYFDYERNKWRSEPTPNKVVSAGQNWRKTRKLEKVAADETKIRIKYRLRKTAGLKKWGQTRFGYSAKSVCEDGSDFQVDLRPSS
jgi:hypothetical protein